MQSSAKRRTWESTTLARSVIKIVMRIGPSTDPCGTPEVTLTSSDFAPSQPGPTSSLGFMNHSECPGSSQQRWFCNSCTLVVTPISFKYQFKPFGMVPSAPITVGITLALTFHNERISLARSWYLSIFSSCFVIILASPGIATSIMWQLFMLVTLFLRKIPSASYTF